MKTMKEEKNMEKRIMDLLTEAGYEVQLRKVFKGGCEKTGISVNVGTNCWPTFYALDGMTAAEQAGHILDMLEGMKFPNMVDMTERLMHYEQIKDALYMVLRPVLEADSQAIKRPFLDLEAIVKIRLNADDDGQHCTRVTRELLSIWKKTEEEVFEQAMSNGFDFYDRLLAGMMHVYSNKAMTEGAAVMMFPERFEPLATVYDSDIIIIPSSVHEVIALPACEVNIDAADVMAMITEVNGSQLAPDEVLSNHAYIYRKDTGAVEIFD